jgi:hypothetical protein
MPTDYIIPTNSPLGSCERHRHSNGINIEAAVGEAMIMCNIIADDLGQ